MNEGTIKKAFQPDGTVIHIQERNRAYTPEVVSITLSAGSQLDFETACNTIHK